MEISLLSKANSVMIGPQNQAPELTGRLLKSWVSHKMVYVRDNAPRGVHLIQPIKFEYSTESWFNKKYVKYLKLN